MVSIQGHHGPSVQNHHQFNGSQKHQRSTVTEDGTAKASTTSSVDTAATATTATTGDDEPSRPGKSSQSPAHMVRAKMAVNAELGQFNFGKLVSMLARSIDLSSLFAPKETAFGETGDGSDSTTTVGATDDTGETTETVAETPLAAPVIAATTADEEDSVGSEASSEGEIALNILA